MKTLKKVWLKCIQLLTLITLSVSASAQLKADFTASPTVGCPPMVVNFEDKSTGNPAEWKWDLGNGTISRLQHPITTYFNAGTYAVKLIVKNANGEDSVAKSQFIVVHAIPTTKFGASDTTGCFPLKVAFTDSSAAGSGTIASWQWDFGDGNLSSLQNPVHTYTNAGSFTVTLRVINSNGCVKVFTRPAYIKLSTGVRSDFSFDMTAGCQSPTPVTFINKTEGTGTITYKWDFGNGITSTLENPVINFNSVGKYTVKLISTNSSGCSDTLIKKDFINIGFVKASFTKADTVCVNQPFVITNTSAPTPVGAVWSFGDSTALDSSLSPTKIYRVPGKYQVKLVSDFGSCLDSVTKSVVVIAGPAVSFVASNLTGCKVPHTVTFTNTSTNGVSYLWKFGDGTSSTLQNPTHTYTKFGNYGITLTVTNRNGCKDSLTKTELVKVVAPKILAINSLPTRGCIPYTINPIPAISSSASITKYFWSFGDGSTSTDPKPTHTYTVGGSYTVKLIVTTDEGCADTLTLVDAVKVGTRPHSDFVADPLDICAETRVNYTDLSNGGIIHEWFWQFGDGGTSIEQNPIHQYTDTGRFDVTLIASNFGCSDTLIKLMYVHVSPPIARFDTAFQCSDPLKRDFIDKSLGATSWAWDFGDGTTSTDQFPSHRFASPGLYKVVLRVSNGTCQHSVTKNVKVINEDPRLSSTDSVTCRNVRMTYTVTNVTAANIKNYTWYPLGPGSTPTVTPLYAIAQYYTTTGVQNPYVIVTDILGCKDSVKTSVPIKVYGPKVGFTVPFTATCFMNAVNFKDTSSSDGIHPITNWIWNYGDGVVKNYNSAPFVHQYDSAGVFGVKLTVVDSYGCRDSVFKPSLLTIAKPVAKFTVPDTLFCPNVPVAFKSQSTGSSITYKWDFGDGSTSTIANPVHTYSKEGVYKVSMVLADKFGCGASKDTMIYIIQTTANFLMSDSFSSCPPLLVDFKNLSKGYTVMTFDFGDGGISTLNNPSHIYTYPGTYFVKVGVRNNGGCTDTLVKKVVIQGPTGVFNYDPLIVCDPGKVDFKATAQNTVKYIWDYRDGTLVYSTSASASHVYNFAGQFVPRLILEDESGCQVPLTGKDTIKVKFIETNILAPRAVLCDSGYVVFKDSTESNDLIQSFKWDFGDGQTSTSRNPTHHYTDTGRYTVSLTAKSSIGCSDKATLVNYIKVVNSPRIKISGDTSACVPGSLTFQGTLLRADTSRLSWNWNFGNGQVSNLQNPPVQSYTAVGKFPVKAVVMNYDGCTDRTTRFAEIRPLPIVNAGADSVICKANTIKLTATGAATYTWDFDPSLNCLNCASPIAKPGTKTTYKVTGKTIYGCAGTDTVTVNVIQPFKMSVNPGDTLCVGENFTLGVSGATTYEWSPSTWLSNASVATPVTKPDSSVTYRVIGKSESSCFTDTGFVSLKVYPMPKMEILGNDMITVNVGSSVQLETKNSPDITQWKWLPAQWLSCSTCPSPKVTPRESRTYTVVGANGGNCVARDEITITLICNNSNVYIPNTFSPNNDGSNDRFYPRGTGVFNIKSLKIFNRWGQIVFQNDGFSPNNAAAGWDGKLKGQELTPDVYVYVMDVICENSQVFPVKGNITLIR
jgi:gliding motility-associated-like protein